MGEGWSDSFAFWAELNTTTPVDFTIGSWVYNNPGGIRSYPYSTSLTTNPHKYSDLKTLSEGAHLLPSVLLTSDLHDIAVHDIGEVWATILFEVYWGLVAAHGYSGTKTDPT